MNRKNKYWLISFSLLLIIDVVLLAKRTNEVVSKIDSGSPVEGTNDSYQSSFIDLLENEGLTIQDMALRDMADNSVKLLSELFVEDSLYLICRVSQYQCQSCASYALEKIIELVEKDSIAINLLFFCEYEYRSLKLFIDEHPNANAYRIYQVPGIDLPIEIRTYPYFFTLSKNMVAHDVFAPETYNSEKTDIYWNSISKKWR